MTDDSREVQQEPAAEPPVRESGPVEGAGGNREVPPARAEPEDDVPRMPASPIDPFTPELHARAGEGRAWNVMRLAWIPILIVVAAIVIWAVTR
jgi:hypothetical protein